MFENTRLSFHPIEDGGWPAGYQWYATGSFSRVVDDKEWYDTCHEETEFLMSVAHFVGVDMKADSESSQIFVYFKTMDEALAVIEKAEAILTCALNIKPDTLIGVSLV